MGSCFSKPNDGSSKEIRIAVVGRTGSGLSQFIHDATGIYENGVAAEAALRPFTSQITPISAKLEGLPNSGKVVLIDTPGFDFTQGNSEHDTFTQLARWVKRQYGSKTRLDGVVYMHNIWNEELIERSPLLASDALEGLCGPNWRAKVVFVNSHWSERVRNDGNDREARLKHKYWSFMLARGSPMVRYEEPRRSDRAIAILSLLISSSNDDCQA